MTGWIIEPYEPLIVRDGRPFGRQPGVLAASLPFPFPATTTGATRNRAGSDEDGTFRATGDQLQALKKIQVRGPLLARMDATSQTWQLLAPAPGDAFLSGEKKCLQLVPLQTPPDVYVQPCGEKQQEQFAEGLALVGLPRPVSTKPADKQPAFWTWETFMQWLLEPEHVCRDWSASERGILPLPQEQRIHVALERGMMVAREGDLFETRGLEFTVRTENGDLKQAHRLALWLDVALPKDMLASAMQSGPGCLGAERRLVHWQKDGLTCPPPPDRLAEQIISVSMPASGDPERAASCRLILLTPAFFAGGYRPNLSSLEYEGIKPRLRAVLVQRPQVISGWDMEDNRRKATRRLMPAGSVFFLDLLGPRANIPAWIERTWMSCVSEEEQDRFDGFGLAVPGIWSGQLEEIVL